jgi:hypothetical protein
MGLYSTQFNSVSVLKEFVSFVMLSLELLNIVVGQLFCLISTFSSHLASRVVS